MYNLEEAQSLGTDEGAAGYEEREPDALAAGLLAILSTLGIFRAFELSERGSSSASKPAAKDASSSKT